MIEQRALGLWLTEGGSGHRCQEKLLRTPLRPAAFSDLLSHDQFRSLELSKVLVQLSAPLPLRDQEFACADIGVG